jgi:hypothetical protein
MHNARISATWLSDEMAHALAAMWPPLGAADVMRTADALTLEPDFAAGLHLLRPDHDRAPDMEPGVVEALRALHDLVA